MNLFFSFNNILWDDKLDMINTKQNQSPMKTCCVRISVTFTETWQKKRQSTYWDEDNGFCYKFIIFFQQYMIGG